MWDFVSGIFDTVVDWVSGVTNEAIGAVAGDVIKGAATGAIIGAATAAIKGEDILDYALSGAAMGGVLTGVVSTIDQFAGLSDVTAKGQLEATGATPVKETVTGGLTQQGTDIPTIGSSRGSAGLQDVTPISTPTQDTSWLTPETAQIVGGVGSGLAAGAMGYLSAGEEAEAEKEILESAAEIERQKIAANVPGEFTAATANIKIPNWWEKHTSNLGVANA